MAAHIGENHVRVLADIVRAFHKMAPSIPTAVVVAATLHVVSDNKARTRVVRQLRGTPELLVSGDSRALPAVNRLIRHLRSEGWTEVEIPRCSDCDRSVQIPHRNGRGGHRCSACNRRTASPPCTHCGRLRPSGYRILDGQPYCTLCWRKDPRSFVECGQCGATRAPARRRDGLILCERCYKPPPLLCSLCDRVRTAAVNRDGTVVCEGCYSGLRQRPRPCTLCDQLRVCPYLSEVGPICAVCADDPTLGRCVDCGAMDRRLTGWRCYACVLPGMVRAVISNHDGNPHPALLPLENFLLRDPARADTIAQWIRRSPMVKVIRQMAGGEFPISLRAVAGLRMTGATGYLAALLMESGVLPTENFDRIRLEVWEEAQFAAIEHAEHRRILQRYAAWVVNPSFSDEGHLSGVDESLRLRRARAHLTTVMDLLNHIGELGMTLDTFPQRAFDEWVAIRGRRGRDATRFMRWARVQRLTRLRSVYEQSGTAAPSFSEDDRWAWVKYLLITEELALSWRVGGLISVVYGTLATRIVSLRRDAVHVTPHDVRLSLGSEPVILPTAMGELVKRLLDTRPAVPSATETWLFPGHRPGRHLTATALKAPLAKRGIRLAGARAVALMTLSRDVPAPVLADLLGISIEAATRWGKLSGHDWADYPRLRHTDFSASHDGD